MSKKEIIVIFILIAIASARFFFFTPQAPSYSQVVGETVILEGVVSEDPDVRLKNQLLKIRINNQKANVLVTVSRNIEVSYGDMVYVKGVLEEPENFITSSGKEFNYKRYLANQDIYFLIKRAEVEILSSGNGSIIKSFLYKIRNAFMKNINRVIGSPESDLANGLVLGARGGFDENTKQEFIDTGTIHIVALSGYNVSIVAEGVMKTFSLVFSQTVSILFGIFIVLLFVIMTGASATAVRAGIMAAIMLLGRMTGRNYLAGRALVVAGLLMVSYDPRVIFDMSFQLSFIATGGVLFLTPKIMHWFNFLPMRFKIRETMASTTAATITVLPILLYLTGVLSLVSIVANILILLFIPAAMLFVFLTGIAGFISATISIPFGYISHLILSYILYIVHTLGSLSFSSVTIRSFPLVFTLIMYAFLLWWMFKKPKIIPTNRT